MPKEKKDEFHQYPDPDPGFFSKVQLLKLFQYFRQGCGSGWGFTWILICLLGKKRIRIPFYLEIGSVSGFPEGRIRVNKDKA